MKFARFLTVSVSTALVVLVLNPLFSDEETNVSANVTLTSDYSFRGWSQTTRDPAIQGGFDLDLSDTFSIGTWGSTVNFGSDTSMELDLYLSMAFETPIPVSLSMIRFEYPSEGEELDYWEFSTSLEVSDVLTIGMNYSPAYLGSEGPTFFYPFVAVDASSLGMPPIGVHMGWSMADEDSFFSDGEDNYLDFRVDFTQTLAGLDVTFAVVGTTLEDVNDAGTRLLLELSKSL